MIGTKNRSSQNVAAADREKRATVVPLTQKHQRFLHHKAVIQSEPATHAAIDDCTGVCVAERTRVVDIEVTLIDRQETGKGICCTQIEPAEFGLGDRVGLIAIRDRSYDIQR